jgi:hypothetical protein
VLKPSCNSTRRCNFVRAIENWSGKIDPRISVFQLLLAVLLVPGPASAQDIAVLVTLAPHNRSARPDIALDIARRIGEANGSMRVRERAVRLSAVGAMILNLDEILADLEAGQQLALAAQLPRRREIAASAFGSGPEGDRRSDGKGGD